MSKQPPLRTPLAPDARRAEREGDYDRARALARLTVQSEGAQSLTEQDRLARLGVDPSAVRAGLMALVAYIGAWIYALGANR